MKPLTQSPRQTVSGSPVVEWPESPGERAGGRVTPTEAAIRCQLTRLADSRQLRSSEKLRRILFFIVEEAMAGRGGELTQYLIGTKALRLPETFDPDSDTIVRAHARRLRKALVTFYAEEGVEDPVVIDIPVGHYAPTFEDSIVRRVARRKGTDERDPEAVPVLAVIEFQAIGLDGVWSHLPLLIAEELFVALAPFNSLQLLGPFGRSQLAGDSIEPPRIGLYHPADYVLDGSLHREGTKITLRVRLHEGATGVQIWADKSDFNDVASLSDFETIVARRILTELGADYGAVGRHVVRQAFRKPLRSLTIYEAILCGRQFFVDYQLSTYRCGLAALRRAVKAVPDSAEAHATLATLLLGGYFEPFSVDADFPFEAIVAAHRALELDPRGPWSLLACCLAALCEGRGNALNDLGGRMLADPSTPPNVGGFAGALLVYGKASTPVGLDLITRAREQNPHYPRVVHVALCLDAMIRADWREAFREIENYSLPGDWCDALFRAVIHAGLGEVRVAQHYHERLAVLFPGFQQVGQRMLRRFWHAAYVGVISKQLAVAGFPLKKLETDRGKLTAMCG